ncbi:MAG: pyridoxamine 5'-phosphate oxidase family protein [Pseudomonadota bacterium]
MSDQPSAFHAGELAVQRRLGVAEQMDALGKERIRRYMPTQHREFFENLPFMVLGVLDAHGRPWVTAAFGPPGFISSPNERALHIGRPVMLKDRLKLDLRPLAKLGAIGIDPLQGRRNRVNGTIRESAKDGLLLSVDQSFGNCAQHIHRRAPRWSLTSRPAAGTARIQATTNLTNDAQALICRADTFFIASRTLRMSSDPTTGVDVSHRGGMEGFVQVLSDSCLRFPDYSGNKFFNTLGNIQDDGRVGLLFPDVGNNSALLLTGQATIGWDGGRWIDVMPHETVTIKKWASKPPD